MLRSSLAYVTPDGQLSLVRSRCRPYRFKCPHCGAALQEPAEGTSPCSTCCYPFDYAKALNMVRDRREEIKDVVGLDSMSGIIFTLDLDEALSLLSGETRQAASLEYVSSRFVIFELGHDAVVFSFDQTQLKDNGDLRRRLRRAERGG